MRLNHANRGCILSCREDVGGLEQRPEPDGVPRELVHTPLFTVDDADGGAADEPGLAEGLDRRKRCTSRGYDVLDEPEAVARHELSLEPVAGSVALLLLADDEERKAGFERGRRGKRDRPELGAGEPHGLRLVLADFFHDALAERAQQLGPRLEAVLV